MDKETKAPPALWHHIEKMWNAMNDRAKPAEVGGKQVNLYEGFTTKLFAEVDVPLPYYKPVLQALMWMDCVTQHRRGGKTTPSQWIVLRAPTLEAFNARPPEKESPGTMKEMVLEKRLQDIERMLGGIDVSKALYDVDQRLRRVEDGVRGGSQEPTG